MKTSHALSILAITTVATVLIAPSNHIAQAISVKNIARNIDDLIGKLLGGGRLTDEEWKEVTDWIRKNWPLADAHPTWLKALATRADALDGPALRILLSDPRLVRLLETYPGLADTIIDAMKRFPSPEWGRRLEMLFEQFPGDLVDSEKISKFITTLVQDMPEDTALVLLRGLDGKTIGKRQLEEAMAVLEESIKSADSQVDNFFVGDMFEIVSRAQLKRGGFKSSVSLKPGSSVLNGQHNSIHGIDGIGVSPSGTPVIFEMTTKRGKMGTRSTPGCDQMSPCWVADSWNKLIEKRPSVVDELRSMGVDKKWLDMKPITEAHVAAWDRKVVVSSQSVADSLGPYRRAAGLSPEDVVVLD